MDNYSSYPHPRSADALASSYPYQEDAYHDTYHHPGAIPRTAHHHHHQPQVSPPSNSDLDPPLPTEYDLIRHSPEDRAIILEVLKERRRVKELELQILEERRREREATANLSPTGSRREALSPWPQQQQQQQQQHAPAGMQPVIGRMALSALGANSQVDFAPRQFSASGIQHLAQFASVPPPSAADGTTTAATYYDHQGAPPPAIRHSLTPPSSSNFQNFDGLGLTSAPLSQQQPPPHDPYASYPQQQQQQVHAAGSPSDSLLHGSSPAPPNHAPGLLWDASLGSMTGITINTNAPPNPVLTPTNYNSASSGPPSSLVPTPPQHYATDVDPYQQMYHDGSKGAPYAISSAGSEQDGSSPPVGHFYPTPPPPHYPQQHYAIATQADHPHPSMQVKHQRLSDAGSSSVPSFNPPQQFTPVPQSTSPSTSASASRKTKKVLVERPVVCQTCHHPICKLLLRGTAEELGVQYDPFYECLKCVPPSPAQSHGASGTSHANNVISSVPGGYGSGGGGFTGSGLRMTRKRTRQTEDTTMPTVCDVCVRTIGRGGLVPRARSTPLAFAVEVICTSCGAKYSRCSDCGGGSGRVGVGKWRAKELFENGRKTCKLPHVRVGGGELELSVWEVPWEVQNRKEFGTLMAALRTLWSERVLARLAIPEVLEGGEEEWPGGGGGEPSTAPPEPPVDRSFGDVEDVIAKGWPDREKVLRTSPGLNHDHFRRYLGLSWAKARARRERAAGKLPDPTKYAEGAQDVLMENVRRTTVLVPPASTLVGMWILDWDMRNRTILLSTSAPFESSDAEDKNIIGVGECLTRIMMDLEQYNKEHPDAPLRGPQHLWVTTRSISALANARMNDTLTRRRGFVPVDEYVALHPGTDRSLFTSVPGGHAWTDEPGWIRHPDQGELEVLVRWLGEDIDMERLDEIKDIEYGKKSKEMQIANRSKKGPGNGGTSPPLAARR